MAVKFPSIVAVHANFLVRAITAKHSSDDELRAAHLIERIEKAKSQLIIPMPALAEFLVLADIASLGILQQLERKSCIRAAPFDRAAAHECAQMDAAALARPDGKKDGLNSSWQKIKIDRQIVAIAKACGAKLIITSDKDIQANARRVGIEALAVAQLHLPDSARQGNLKLVKSSGKSKS